MCHSNSLCCKVLLYQVYSESVKETNRQYFDGGQFEQVTITRNQKFCRNQGKMFTGCHISVAGVTKPTMLVSDRSTFVELKGAQKSLSDLDWPEIARKQR